MSGNPALLEAYCYVPDSWNFSRFLKNVIELEENHGMITDMIRQLREALMDWNFIKDIDKLKI